MSYAFAHESKKNIDTFEEIQIRLSSSRNACTLAFALVCVGGCSDAPAPEAEVRPVRTIVAEMREFGTVLEGVGEIQPRFASDLGFRVAGKLIERRVNVGDTVQRGDLLARIDDEDQRNQLRAAQAAVAAVRAALDQAIADEARQRQLLERQLVAQSDYDAAVRARDTARANFDADQAQLQLAQDRLSYTQLLADDTGTITATAAEAGQVVNIGQVVVRLASQAQKDAVFNVSEETLRLAPSKNPSVEVSLLSDPSVIVVGVVREVAPEADPVTRTFEVKVGLPEAPDEMLLGAAVRGAVRLPGQMAIALPAAALNASDGQPAVWRFNAESQTVELVPVQVLRYEADQVFIASGIEANDRIVTAGVQRLRPNQPVRLLETGGL